MVAERACSLCVLADMLFPTSCCSYPDTDRYEQPPGGRFRRATEPVWVRVPLVPRALTRTNCANRSTEPVGGRDPVETTTPPCAPVPGMDAALSAAIGAHAGMPVEDPRAPWESRRAPIAMATRGQQAERLLLHVEASVENADHSRTEWWTQATIAPSLMLQADPAPLAALTAVPPGGQRMPPRRVGARHFIRSRVRKAGDGTGQATEDSRKEATAYAS